MANLGEHMHIKLLPNGNWGFKVVKISVDDYKIPNYAAKKRKGAQLQPDLPPVVVPLLTSLP